VKRTINHLLVEKAISTQNASLVPVEIADDEIRDLHKAYPELSVTEMVDIVNKAISGKRDTHEGHGTRIILPI
jgi:hypothetical protein